MKPEGSKGIKIGELIALTVAEGEDWQNVAVPADMSSPISDVSLPTPSEGVSSPPAKAPTSAPGSVPFGPAARNIMEVYNIKPSDVPATGPGGRLTKGDLLQYIGEKNMKPAPIGQSPSVEKSPPTAPPPTPGVATATPTVPDGQAFVDIELSNMRKTIAQRLTQSKATIPHAYSVIDCNVGDVMRLRKSLKEEGVTISLNDILIKAVAVTLQMVPEVNATWTGEGSRVLSNIDIATAVATEGGLITPIVKNAVGLGLQEISATIRELAEKARNGSLQPDEYQGGTFTISNLGMYGISEFTAIVNPPSASILAIGGTRTELDDDARPYPVLTVTLCSDSRVVDDALAARFLSTFCNVIEKPMLMLSQGAPVDLQALFAK
ncbi:Pyruvate dehydrogenase protein X component, mitochondrial [Lamellibrachia satsuma]|nr:Pyruvate dehydrogenase protein X component, mitochondrial [Lamellibrachia satsuma]